MKSRTRKRLIALAVVGVVAASGVITLRMIRNAGREHAAEEKLAQGLELYEQGRYAESIEPLNYSVEAGNRDPDVMLKFADARRKTPQENNLHLRHAVTLAKDVASREDPPGEAHEMLLDLYTRLGQAPELVELTEDILEAKPDHLRAGVLQIQALLQLNRVDGIVEKAEELVRNHPTEIDAQAMLFETMRVVESSDDDLWEKVEDILEDENSSARSLLLAAQTMLRLSDSGSNLGDAENPLIVQAAGILERVLGSLEGESSQTAELTIGLCDIASRQITEWADQRGLSAEQREALPNPGARAESFVNQALEFEQNPELRSFAIQRRWKQGRIPESVIALVSATGDLAQARTEDLGLLLMTVRDPSSPIDLIPEGYADRLQAELESRVSGSPETERWRLLALGVEQAANGDHVSARDQYEEVATRAEGVQQQIARFMHAQSLIRVAEDAAGIRILGQLAADPAWRRARYLLARVSLDNNDVATTISVLMSDPAIRRWPDGVALVTSAALIQAESPGASAGQLQLALSLSASYMEVLGQTPLARALRGRALAANGQIAEAVELANALLDVAPGSASEDIREFADRLEPIDRDLAEQLRTHAVTQADSPFSAIAQRIEALIDEGRLDTAERELALIGETSDPNEQLGLDLARALIARERGEPGAIDRLRELAEEHGESAEAQLALLNSPGAWQDLENPDHRAALDEAIERLEGAAGSSGIMGTIHRANLNIETADSDNISQEASQSLIKLEEVLRVDPTNRQALVAAARAADILNDYSESTNYLFRARNAAPGRADVYPALITSLIRQQRTDEAEDLALEFSQRSVSNPVLVRRRAEILEILGLRQNALEDRKQLADLGRPSDQIAYASLLARLGQLEAASDAVADVDAGGLAAEQRLSLARVLALSGDPTGAEQLFANSAQSGSQVAQVLLETGHAERGTELAIESARSSAEAEPWLVAIRALIQLGRPVEAGELASEGAARASEKDDLSAIAQALGDEDFTRLDVIASSALTIAATEQGDESIELAGILRRLLTGERAPRQIANDLERFVSSRPQWYSARFTLASLYEEIGQDDRAAQTTRNSVQSIPGNPRVAADATRLLLRLGRFEAAAPTARRWKELSGADTFEADIHLASAVSAMGRSGEAVGLFAPHHDRLLADHENYRPVVEQYLVSLAATGGFDRVEEVFDSIQEQTDEWGLTMVRLASIVPLSQSEVARGWIGRAGSFLAKTSQGRFYLASSWNALGNKAGNPEDFQRSVAVLDGSDGNELPQTYAAAAASASSLGDLEAATGWYAKAYEAGSTDPLLLNNYAYQLVQAKSDAEKAAGLAEQAVAAARDQNFSGAVLKEFLDTLGLAQLQSDRADDAVGTFREAVRIDPFAPHLSIGLAEALAATQADEEAKSILESINRNGLSADLLARLVELEKTLEDS